MNKIQTLFVRDTATNLRYLTRKITPGCEWVVAGEGVATRKYDGTCVMFDGLAWWARREVKPGRTSPPGFVLVEHDGLTGKSVGWEPVEQSPFAKFHVEVIESVQADWQPGTYELVGPKINGNPEGFSRHLLVRHDQAVVWPDCPTGYDELRELLLSPEFHWEGLVWHHSDGRMAKIKTRDFSR
jgi:hypothetical protein